MADGERLTHWQKARADWPGFQWRDLVVAGVGLALAVAILAILGFPGKTVVEVVVVAGAGVAAALLFALGQLVWAWLRAPMRLLTEDVIAIRERLEATPLTSPEPPVNVRLSLLNSIRLGEELAQLRMVPIQAARAREEWAAPVVAMLTRHVEQTDAEEFLRQNNLRSQIDVLRQLLEKYPS